MRVILRGMMIVKGRSFRPSKIISQETDPEIQGFQNEMFGNSQEVGETESEGENDEMGQTKSSSSPQGSSSSSRVEYNINICHVYLRNFSEKRE